MANVEINDLTAKLTAAETDELEIQETAGGDSKKITRANFIPDSSETVKGKVELATTAETTTGTDTARATTPAGVKAVADTKANTSHTHAAADVTSGLLANARIATGTPDGTKYLRDDQSWQAIPGGGDALTSNPLSQFAATTSLQLKNTISDETGSGALVFGTSPAITTPTGIVKGDVGLGNVDNTSDASKPVSSATQTALDAKQNLDTDLTDIAALTPTNDDVIQRKAGAWTNRTMAQVKTDLALVKGDVGLGNVDNTSDANKPVSTATQTALDAKQASGATLTSLEGLSLVAGDILYATAADTLSRVAIGTANQELRVNAGATAPEWYTPSAGGGQTLVDHIVAASGGTHTTLQAALDSASAGDTIYVRSGTFALTASKSSTLANLTIIGENPQTSIIDMTGGSYSLTLSGGGAQLINLKFTLAGGAVNISSASDCLVQGCVFAPQTANIALNVGNDTRIVNNRFEHSTSSNQMLYTTGSRNQITGNTFDVLPSSNSSIGVVQLGATHNSVVGNFFYISSGTTESPFVATASGQGHQIVNSNYFSGTGNQYGFYANSSSYCQFVGNRVYNVRRAFWTSGSDYVCANNVIYGGATTSMFAINAAADNGVISGNNIFNGAGTGGTGIIVGGSEIVVTGNRIRSFTTGIDIGSSGYYRTIVTSNNLDGNTTAFSDLGTNTASNNNVGVPTTQERRSVRMKNTSGGTVAAGGLVTFKSVANGDEVTTTTAAGDTKVFGMAEEAINNNAYGYIQVSGKTTLLKVNGTTDIAIGDYLTSFTTAGIAAKATAGQMAFAIALEAYTTDDSNGVIDALIVSPRLI